MTYLRHTSVSEKKNKTIIVSITVVLVLVFCVQFFFPKFYPTIFYPITSTFWRMEYSASSWSNNMGLFINSQSNLVKDNQTLTDELNSQSNSLLELSTLKAENENLKSFLGRPRAEKSVLGVILARPPISIYDTLVIDIGSSLGVKIGDQVYAPGDVLIGDISEVYANQSKVSLFSSPGRIVSVLLGAGNAIAQAEGRGGGNFVAQLPIGVGIKEGDVVTMPQIKTHTFTIVEKIAVDSTGSLETVYFKSPVNINELRFVEVLI